MPNIEFEKFIETQNSRVAIQKAAELAKISLSFRDIVALNELYENQAWHFGSDYTIDKFLGETDYGTLSQRAESAHDMKLWDGDNA